MSIGEFISTNCWTIEEARAVADYFTARRMRELREATEPAIKYVGHRQRKKERKEYLEMLEKVILR